MKDAMSLAAAVGVIAIAMIGGAPQPLVPTSALALTSTTGRLNNLNTSQVFTVVDFPPTPSTLPELLKAVDLVVLARVDATSRAQADLGGPSPKIRRIQDLTVLEVLKGNSRGRQIKVRQTGGTVSVDGKDPTIRSANGRLVPEEKDGKR